MGYNTSIIVRNDCLNAIADDPDFGRNLANAINGLRPRHGNNVRAGGSSNAATAIETHHSSDTVFVAIGGNRGEVVSNAPGHNTDEEVELLKMLADKHGYYINPI